MHRSRARQRTAESKLSRIIIIGRRPPVSIAQPIQFKKLISTLATVQPRSSLVIIIAGSKQS